MDSKKAEIDRESVRPLARNTQFEYYGKMARFVENINMYSRFSPYGNNR